MAVLGVHVVETILGGGANAEATWGALYAMLIILLYFVPLVSAALTEKYGYKNVLIPAFGVMIAGYFLLSFVRPNQFVFLTLALILLGIGAGAFKPIISGTIAHITLDSQRNLAYSIYYWMINLGAFLFPLIIGFFFKTLDTFHLIFFISVFLISINLAITFLLYQNPIQPQPDLAIDKAIRRIIPALKDRKFLILLLIYSGFWFMFAYNHTFLPVYMVQFHRMPEWFVVAWLATINPGTIIILGPFLGKLVEKYKSLNVMMVGIIIFCIGILINGTSNIPALFVLGIIIFSIGEFITHPGFIAYVSKIAPKEMVTIYMACIFISTGLGNAIGGAVQGAWYSYFTKSLLMPKVYIALVASVGLITLICLIIYNRWIISETLKADPLAKVDKGIFTKTITAGIVLLFIPITLYGAYLGGTDTLYESEEEIKTKILEEIEISGTETGYTNENQATEFNFIVSEETPRLVWVNCSLSWTDESSSYPFGTNDPDQFSVAIIAPDGTTMDESGLSTSGPVTSSVGLDYKAEGFKDTYLGEWTILIQAGTCGDDNGIGSFGIIRTTEDTGNAWTLEFSYTYMEEVEEA
jgi:MFS family permease